MYGVFQNGIVGISQLSFSYFYMKYLGEYNFPPDDWKDVSQTAKDLIKSMLRVDVNRRIDINTFMQSPWIAESQAVPSTPLVTSKNMMGQGEN